MEFKNRTRIFRKLTNLIVNFRTVISPLAQLPLPRANHRTNNKATHPCPPPEVDHHKIIIWHNAKHPSWELHNKIPKQPGNCYAMYVSLAPAPLHSLTVLNVHAYSHSSPHHHKTQQHPLPSSIANRPFHVHRGMPRKVLHSPPNRIFKIRPDTQRSHYYADGCNDGNPVGISDGLTLGILNGMGIARSR